MSKQVSMNKLVPLIVEMINKNKEITITAQGNSMMPMLKSNKDKVVLIKKPKMLKKYDVALYYRENEDTYVLHRYIKKGKNNTYIMCGDNQYVKEHNITNKNIIAVVKSFTHKGKLISTNNFFYKLYCILWNNSRFIRKAINKVKRKLTN